MRILMVSPHPTYTPRGTPISVLNRCRALCALGHEIDLVTYGIGEDIPVEGLTWRRAPVPTITSVKVGPSLAKLPLDFAVFLKATIFAIRGRRHYDVIHTHEEAGILGALVSRVLRLPHVYDMGNDLSVVLANYGFSPRHPLTRVSVATETATVRGSDSVIAHFPSIALRVAGIAKGRIPATVVSNVPIEAPAEPSLTADLRQQWSPDGRPVVLYTGTLEKYQGVPALIQAAALVKSRGLSCRIVIIGGTGDQQDDLRRMAADLGVEDMVVIDGAVSQDRIGSCLAAADVLVSPRAGGSNTPLKIFSYMHAGKPLLATRIAGHLQVLDDESATLVEPTAEGLADGLGDILDDPARAQQRAVCAQRIAQDRYSLTAYIRQVADAYVAVGGRSATATELTHATDVVYGDLLRAAG